MCQHPTKITSRNFRCLLFMVLTNDNMHQHQLILILPKIVKHGHCNDGQMHKNRVLEYIPDEITLFFYKLIAFQWIVCDISRYQLFAVYIVQT